MNLIKEFRDSSRIKSLAKAIHRELDRDIKIMEVCGGHTHTIMKYGLHQLLPEGIKFVHGPGCPVCVIPKERIDQAVSLLEDESNIVVCLGDVVRVPGSKASLGKKRAEGGNVKVVYSPLDAIKVAKENPDSKVIYFAIGFETTTPMTASVVEYTLKESIKNLFFHINHVLVPPPIMAIMDSKEANIDAFIAPSHVSVITGAGIYKQIVDRYATPVVVAGFEPVDILESVLMIVRQFKREERRVEIQYSRAVNWEGNKKAQELIDRYFTRRETFRWRGIGDIPYSGLRLRQEYSFLDAEVVFSNILPKENVEDHKLCICGDILKGRAIPTDCRVFGKLCTPNNPLGACMVSSEGACAAYYKYGVSYG